MAKYSATFEPVTQALQAVQLDILKVHDRTQQVLVIFETHRREAEHGKQKRVAEEEEEDQSCDGKTLSNEILKGQVRTAKSGRPPQKTEGEH